MTARIGRTCWSKSAVMSAAGGSCPVAVNTVGCASSKAANEKFTMARSLIFFTLISSDKLIGGTITSPCGISKKSPLYYLNTIQRLSRIVSPVKLGGPAIPLSWYAQGAALMV